VATAESVIVVGIGLNVTLSPDQVDGGGATSLAALGARLPSRDALVTRLLSELGKRVDAWRRAGGADDGLQDDYRERSLTIASRVRATIPGKPDIIGIARAVDGQGRLCIESDGDTVAVSAGDIVHLRPV
jgi:BirA family biotin operon repressor/biotin-[acetyl-CoA-carboxylase] ligase